MKRRKAVLISLHRHVAYAALITSAIWFWIDTGAHVSLAEHIRLAAEKLLWWGLLFALVLVITAEWPDDG